jgi:hypothetical protein
MADWQKVVDAVNAIEDELAGVQDSREASLAKTAFQEAQLWLSLVPEVQDVTGFGYAKQEHDKQVAELQAEVDELRKQLADKSGSRSRWR